MAVLSSLTRENPTMGRDGAETWHSRPHALPSLARGPAGTSRAHLFSPLSALGAGVRMELAPAGSGTGEEIVLPGGSRQLFALLQDTQGLALCWTYRIPDGDLTLLPHLSLASRVS